MSYPNRSNFVSSAIGSAWWRSGDREGRRFVCASTGGDMLGLLEVMVRENHPGRQSTAAYDDYQQLVRDFAATRPRDGHITLSWTHINALQSMLRRLRADSLGYASITNQEIDNLQRTRVFWTVLAKLVTALRDGSVRVTGGHVVVPDSVVIPDDAVFPRLGQTLRGSPAETVPCTLVGQEQPEQSTTQQFLSTPSPALFIGGAAVLGLGTYLFYRAAQR